MNLLPIIIIGGGGHAKVVMDIILKSSKYHVVGYTAPKDHIPVMRSGIKYLGDDSILPILLKQGVTLAALAIGSVGENRLRAKLYERIHKFGFSFPPLVHPSAIMATDVLISEASIIGPGAVINPDVEIGVNVIVNSAVVIEHDCFIGKHVHISPGAVICGGVRVGDLAHVGAGAVIIQGLSIGEGAVIGAGAVVLHDVEPWSVVAGNPGRVIRKLKE